MGRIIVRAYAITIISSMLFVSIAMSAEISSLRISQANSKLPVVKTYIDISDASGNMVPNILANQLTATIGAELTEVESLIPFEQSNEGIAYVLLVDVSKSLQEPQFVKIREALNAWIDDISPKDRVSIMTFGTNVTLLQDFTPDKELLKNKVKLVKPSDNDTRLHLGLVKAMETGRRTDADLPARRVIVTMSDGDNDFAGGMTKQEVISKIKEEQIPIYSIGFYKPPYSSKKEDYLKILGEFSRTSGGEYYKAGDKSFLEMYTAIRNRIKNVYIAGFKCSTCVGDGRIYRLQVKLSSGHKSMTDGKDIRLFPKEILVAPESAPSQEQAAAKSISIWIYIAGGSFLIFFILIMMMKKSKSENISIPSHENSFVLKKPEAGSEIKSAAGVKIKLTTIGIDDPNSPYIFEVSDSAVIGRSQSQCDIILIGDDEISGKHCEMVLNDDTIYVVDLDSTNGTILNGVPLTGKQKIEDGDMLLIGGTEFRVSIYGG